MPNYPEQTCKMCGKDLSNKRIDAKYCDDRCRMRYNRYRKKEKLIEGIIEICGQIPNNTEQMPDGITKLRVKDLKTGKVNYLTNYQLKNCSMKGLEALLKQKGKELMIYKTTGVII